MVRPGQSVAGRWRVIMALEDRAAHCFRVRDERGNDAELLLLPLDAELEERANSLRSLSHENIIATFDAGSWQGRSYLVRELVMGQSVADRLRREGRLGYDQALGIACQLCLASAEAARAGIGFLGLHPGNVLVTIDGFAKVDPLRLDRHEDDERYLSPEERRHGEPGQKSDLFRIGLLIHEMLSGGLPGRDGFGKVRFEPLAGGDPSLPPALDEALGVALAGEPQDRYADADSFLDRLHPLLMRRPPSAAAGPTRWHEDRRFWLYIAIALGALALILTFLTGVVPFPFGG